MGAGPMKNLFTRLSSQDFMSRALRSSAFTVVGYGGQQVLRLASNLILTRLLFPEAFGMMVLVSVFMMGLNMFSDVGVTPAIMQSKRGDVAMTIPCPARRTEKNWILDTVPLMAIE